MKHELHVGGTIVPRGDLSLSVASGATAVAGVAEQGWTLESASPDTLPHVQGDHDNVAVVGADLVIVCLGGCAYIVVRRSVRRTFAFLGGLVV